MDRSCKLLPSSLSLSLSSENPLLIHEFFSPPFSIKKIKSIATSQITSTTSPKDPLDNLSLAELTDSHVKSTVENVAASDIVQSAWKEGRDLSVHGWVYHVGSARLRDLDVGYKGVGVKADSLSRPSTYAESEPKED